MRLLDAHRRGMDHGLIDKDLIVERYVMGRLDGEERRLFEEHFVECRDCLDRLDAAAGLRAGLKEVVPLGEGRSSAPAIRQLPRARSLWTLLAAACFLLAALSSIFFYGEVRRTRRELESVRLSSQRAQSRQAELEQALEKERAARAVASQAANALRAAPMAATVFMLNRTRGATATQPENRIELAPSSGWVVWIFDRPEAPGVRTWRVRLSTDDGHPVGDPVNATPSSAGMLAASFPATLLPAGDYVLVVEAAAGPGRAEAVARYGIRVARRS